ncbi:MAG TPA: phosphoglycerate kinase [Candidatus Nanoarchaeia archaeon]|nr:phosphoglycerate kinase [Candidatus Nanoarchaeia archaeon]
MELIFDLDIKGKTILLREDINSDVVKGKVLLGERIKASAKVISDIKRKGARVVVIAHQGRSGEEDFVSLKQHADFLNKITKIKFVDDIYGERAIKAIKNLKNGEAILLENLRFEKEETNPSKGNVESVGKMVETLSRLCDIYVNDAFSNSHRNHASIIEFPRVMKSCAGPLLYKELNALEKITLKHCLYILGGAKPEENIRLLGKNKVLACGLFGQLCLIASGKNLGEQNKYLRKTIENYDAVVEKLKGKLDKVIMPIGFAVEIKGKRVELGLDKFPNEHEIYDIDKKSQEVFVDEIKKAKSIYMKGPAGHCGDDKFCDGTYAILKAISQSKGFSVIGGGHLSDAIAKSKISEKKFNHISLSGGALLRYLAGEKLPGIEALK